MTCDKRTNIYIDGFNLYFGALKRTPFRWLNLAEMCRLLLPKNCVHEIKYFTALVTPRPGDEQQPMRQQTYLRALRTIPNISVILGHFLSHEVKMPLAASVGGKLQYVSVLKIEEKGSDVNLAVHLLNDAYQNRYDMAVVISNDSDLAAAVKIVKEQLHKPVGIVNPHKHPSKTLLAHATFFKTLRQGVLRVSQLPEEMSDANGTFHKPRGW